MATAKGDSRNRKQPHYIRDIVLNGRISSETRCKLVKDVLKFLLFHREQIPLPFEQLKSYFDKQENIRKGSEAKKLAILLDAVQDLCTNLDDLFRDNVPVDSLMILFGSTVATPKEIYKIQFSNEVPSEPLARVPSAKMCSRLLHKSLVTYNALIDAKPPSVTSLHILFQGHRSGCASWFKPKHNFKMPMRGQRFTFQILSTKAQISSGRDDETRSEIDVGEIGRNGQLQGSDLEMELAANHEPKEDLIWFTAPKPIKGVKDTVLCIPQQGEMWV